MHSLSTICRATQSVRDGVNQIYRAEMQVNEISLNCQVSLSNSKIYIYIYIYIYSGILSVVEIGIKQWWMERN